METRVRGKGRMRHSSQLHHECKYTGESLHKLCCWRPDPGKVSMFYKGVKSESLLHSLHLSFNGGNSTIPNSVTSTCMKHKAEFKSCCIHPI